MALVINCFRISEKPEIEVELIDVVKGNSVKIKAVIDTGFSGWVIVDNETYSKISSLELDEDHWKVYSTLIGNIRARVARCIIKIGDIKINGFVESPIFGRNISLIGREVLKRLKITINKGEEICIQDP